MATAAVEVDTGRLTFGVQPRGTVSATRELTVFSTGERTLRVRGVLTGGAASSDFIVAGDTCSAAPIPRGASCTIAVRFAPEQPGARLASLRFATNAPGDPAFGIVLDGTGGTLPAGPGGAPGQAGSAGPPGPPGPAGADRELLVAAFASSTLRGTHGRRMTIRYVATTAARVALALRRGRRVVARAAGTAARGRNTIALRLPAARGRYSLTLTAVAGSERVTDRARITVS
jgi:hypothetical protein